MAIIVRVPGVFEWHTEIVTFSLDLIETFIQNIEGQAEQFVIRFENERELIEDDDGLTVTEVHQGLDGVTYNLEWVYGEYFPSLHRSSALLTLWSFFKRELDQLCLMFQAEKRSRLCLSDLAESGIARSIRYLDKVASLNVHLDSQEWRKIKAIQKVRNAIAHRSGTLRDGEDAEIRNFINATESLSLNHEDQIVIGTGFLADVVASYKGYFNLIGDSISALRNTVQRRT